MSVKKFKTISQYGKLSATELLGGTCFLVSQPDNQGSYYTKSTSLSSIHGYLSVEINNTISTYLGTNEKNIIPEIKRDISSIMRGNAEIEGTLVFHNVPKYINEDGEDESFITETGAATLIQNTGTFISPNLCIDWDPDNCSNSGKTEEPDEEYALTAHIDSGKKQTDTFICNHTGYLTLYGWLADDGKVLPQEAWVALCGTIKNPNKENDDDYWVILQVQPWVVSDRSHIIQYVGFNIPVKKDMKLKIRCGFNVSESSSATNTHNTLTYAHVAPNRFVGYILHSE